MRRPTRKDDAKDSGGPEKPGRVLIDNIEVCHMLGVKPHTWRSRVAKGLAPLPFTVMGARTYYRIADIEYYCRHGLWPARMKFRGLTPDPLAESDSDA